jgi:hypothetical protein
MSLRTPELNKAFINALGEAVYSHGALDRKPVRFSLASPFDLRAAAFVFNMVTPSKRRRRDHKIVLGKPGVKRGEKGEFFFPAGVLPILAGYRADLDIWALWEARNHTSFTSGENVQVANSTVLGALSNEIQRQQRKLADGTTEIVRTCRAQQLKDCLLSYKESL